MGKYTPLYTVGDFAIAPTLSVGTNQYQPDESEVRTFENAYFNISYDVIKDVSKTDVRRLLSGQFWYRKKIKVKIPVCDDNVRSDIEIILNNIKTHLSKRMASSVSSIPSTFFPDAPIYVSIKETGGGYSFEKFRLSSGIKFNYFSVDNPLSNFIEGYYVEFELESVIAVRRLPIYTTSNYENILISEGGFLLYRENSVDSELQAREG